MLPGAAATGSWSSECGIDPLSVATSVKGDLLVRTTATMAEHGADLATATCHVWDTRKWFVSSEGHRIDQHIRECGAGISATAIGEDQTQRRSYPSYRGQYGTRGWELVDELDLPAHAARIADEAQALLTAPLCPQGETTLILGGEQLALQIHESVGHAIELDRILGWEAAYAASQPRMRSSSMACPTDSWICNDICSSPRMSVVSPGGHSGAVSSARASSTTRVACAGRSMRCIISQPTVPNWPR